MYLLCNLKYENSIVLMLREKQTAIFENMPPLLPVKKQ
jgi:hypothetical protein